MSLSCIYRKTRFRLLKVLSLSISAILGIFFNSGCSKYGAAPEYGMPHADFQVSGTVLSADRKLPIKGLLVTIRDTLNTSGIIDSAKTDSTGKYSLHFSGAPGVNAWELKVEDIDLSVNGLFVSKDTIVSIPESDLQDPSGNWYGGRGEKNVDLKLDRET